MKYLVKKCEYCKEWKWFFQIKGIYYVLFGNDKKGCKAQVKLCNECLKELIKENRISS